MINHTIGFIGSGQMARALAQGFLSAGLVEGGRIVHCDPVPVAAEQFAQHVAGSRRAASNVEVIGQANVIFLAVKPQNMAAVFSELGGKVASEKLVVSIAAGVTLARLSEGLKMNRVVRVMPNTPALV